MKLEYVKIALIALVAFGLGLLTGSKLPPERQEQTRTVPSGVDMPIIDLDINYIRVTRLPTQTLLEGSADRKTWFTLVDLPDVIEPCPEGQICK